MSDLRVLIVDDEPLGRRVVRQLLAIDTDIDVLGEARNGREAIRLLQELKPEIVFLDVQMPDMDGFAVLRATPAQDLPLVVFVTAFDSFAVRAFEANALDYLVKPLNELRFREAVLKARERLRSKEAIELSRRLAQLLGAGELSADKQSQSSKRLLIGSVGGGVILESSDIDWICAEDYYAAVYSNGRKHLVRESLASISSRLDKAQFLRVHRKVIVNLHKVHEIVNESCDGGFLKLRDGCRVPMSRRLRMRVASALRELNNEPRRTT